MHDPLGNGAEKVLVTVTDGTDTAGTATVAETGERAPEASTASEGGVHMPRRKPAAKGEKGRAARTPRARKPAARGPAAILRTYAAGASLTELKKKFGIRGKGHLASAVLDALISSGKMPPIGRGRAAKPAPTEFKVAVNRRGTIVLPKAAVVDAFRCAPGQKFTARRRGKKIILTAAG